VAAARSVSSRGRPGGFSDARLTVPLYPAKRGDRAYRASCHQVGREAAADGADAPVPGSPPFAAVWPVAAVWRAETQRLGVWCTSLRPLRLRRCPFCSLSRFRGRPAALPLSLRPLELTPLSRSGIVRARDRGYGHAGRGPPPSERRQSCQGFRAVGLLDFMSLQLG